SCASPLPERQSRSSAPGSHPRWTQILRSLPSDISPGLLPPYLPRRRFCQVLSCDDPLLLPAEGTAFPVHSKSPSSVFHWKNYCETPASPAETAPHGRLPSDTSFRPEASPCHILPQHFSCQGNDF